MDQSFDIVVCALSFFSIHHPDAVFIGFAPYNDPEVTIATRIAYGYTSANAAQFSRDVLSYYFKVEGSDSLVNGVADEATNEIIDD